MKLPESIDPVSFDQQFRLDTSAWRDAVVEVCSAEGLQCSRVRAFPDGSNLVAEVDGGWIVKIFPPFHEHQWTSEWRALSHLERHELPVAVPRLRAHGTRPDGWGYVVLEKLSGSSLEECWDTFELRDKVRVLERAGATMAAMHRLPLRELVDLPPEWGSFIGDQKAKCAQRHARLGAPSWFQQKLADFVATWWPDTGNDARVLLTGEYTPFNLLATNTPSGWTLTAMIDFGDAMVGVPEYDLLGPSMFSCGGDARLVAALFRGYFGDDYSMTARTRLRLMALALLHRYANFDVQLRIQNWRTRVDSFEELAELVWPWSLTK